MGEIAWCDIPGCPDYQASTYGHIRSLKWGRCKLLKEQTAHSGHRRVSISRHGKSRPELVHQLVLKAFIGDCPEGMMARHLNGDPSDNRLVNLEWGTRSANTYDSVLHGSHPQSRKTHCKNNQEYSSENTYWHGNERHCRVCRKTARNKFKESK